MKTLNEVSMLDLSNLHKDLVSTSGRTHASLLSRGGLGDASQPSVFWRSDIALHSCVKPKLTPHQNCKNDLQTQKLCGPNTKITSNSNCRKLNTQNQKFTKPGEKNMETNKKQNSELDVITTCVRLRKEEHQKLSSAALVQGMSLPQLLKHVALHGPLPVPLLGAEDCKAVLTQLSRIGNNINQVARKLNAGFRDGFHQEFEVFQRDFNSLYAFLMKRKLNGSTK